MDSFQKGDIVFWEDPDAGHASGVYQVEDIDAAESIAFLTNRYGSETHAFFHELRKLENPDRPFDEFWDSLSSDDQAKFLLLAREEGLPGVELAYYEGELTYFACRPGEDP